MFVVVVHYDRSRRRVHRRTWRGGNGCRRGVGVGSWRDDGWRRSGDCRGSRNCWSSDQGRRPYKDRRFYGDWRSGRGSAGDTVVYALQFDGCVHAQLLLEPEGWRNDLHPVVAFSVEQGLQVEFVLGSGTADHGQMHSKQKNRRQGPVCELRPYEVPRYRAAYRNRHCVALIDSSWDFRF